MGAVIPRIAVTSGEPAGIGPDLVLGLARRRWAARLIVSADPALLADRAERLAVDVSIRIDDGGREPGPAGTLYVAPVPLATPTIAGRLDAANVPYVIESLRSACAGCMSGHYDALVTAPVHKGVINDAGVPFSGHTEFLAAETGGARPVMLLVAGTLRVALVTTHLPLSAVPAAIDRASIEAVAAIVEHDLRRLFGIGRPRIVVLGLNPHAGESGHLGREEIDEIAPAIDALRRRGFAIEGPVPADTAFVERHLAGVDAVLAMYHDQGLPVLKHRGFGRAVNVTLGLPIIRTSVDHGTALDLAGTGRADGGSLQVAAELAIDMVTRRACAAGIPEIRSS